MFRVAARKAPTVSVGISTMAVNGHERGNRLRSSSDAMRAIEGAATSETIPANVRSLVSMWPVHHVVGRSSGTRPAGLRQ